LESWASPPNNKQEESNMDEVTKRVRETESKLIGVLNESGLPPVVLELILNGLTASLRAAEEQAVPPDEETK